MCYDPFIEGERRDELGSSMCEIPDTGINKAETGIEQSSDDSENDSDEPSEFASKQDVINALDKAFSEDKELHIKLLYFTNSKIWYYFFSGTFRGKDANDVLQDVIEKIITGKRSWNKKKIPNIVEFILMVIVSHVRNEWKKKEICEECVEDFDNVQQLKENNLAELTRETARQDVENELFSRQYEDICNECLANFEDDEIVYFVLELMLDGIKSNKEIAAELKISVNEVSNAKRRIKYRIKELLKKINK